MYLYNVLYLLVISQILAAKKCYVRVKVKCALVQALRICTGRTVHKGSRGIALLFLDHGTRRGWGVSVTPRPLFTPGKDPVPIIQEAGWAPGSAWTGAENLAPTEIRSPDRPARCSVAIPTELSGPQKSVRATQKFWLACSPNFLIQFSFHIIREQIWAPTPFLFKHISPAYSEQPTISLHFLSSLHFHFPLQQPASELP